MRHLIVASLVGLFIVGAATTASATDEGVACRTRNNEGTNQLVLSWEGASAKGTLERTGASGNVTKVIVRAERQGDTIVADDIYEKDLVSHAAVIRVANGKRYMRTEATWLACE